MNAPRTYLFVPGNRPERFGKALLSGADAVVLDLEDAVSADAKSAARHAIAGWLPTVAERQRVVLRINDAASAHFADDLRLCAEVGIGQLMLPKTETPQQLAAVRAVVPAVLVLALVETARGIANAQTLAACAGVTRLVFGTLDFALDLELDISEQFDALSHGAGCLGIASRLAGLPTPVAGVTPQIDDTARLAADLAWERRHGFGAKLCIHPRQIEPVHAALAPSAEAVAWAHRVLAAEAASPGAARLDGRMIDRPVVLQAERTLQRAGVHSLGRMGA
ncbi:MAG: CoA ester lyase [Rubrivivax sp.]|nr:CoA ester lyase [Rubrivivax sp.]MBK8526203.1 CoA ester lyase [Rubrivivax sp.]